MFFYKEADVLTNECKKEIMKKNRYGAYYGIKRDNDGEL